MLTEAVCAPFSIDNPPKARMANPIPSKTRPSPNFTGPEGLNLLSQIFENKGAKVMIKNEFKMPNHEAGTSATGAVNSLLSIQMMSPQMMIKLKPRNAFDNAYFLN